VFVCLLLHCQVSFAPTQNVSAAAAAQFISYPAIWHCLRALYTPDMGAAAQIHARPLFNIRAGGQKEADYTTVGCAFLLDVRFRYACVQSPNLNLPDLPDCSKCSKK
jgi:hypothetical protein